MKIIGLASTAAMSLVLLFVLTLGVGVFLPWERIAAPEAAAQVATGASIPSLPVGPLGRPFGGQIYLIDYCVNGIWTFIGPPRGGFFLWVPGTVSFLFGPPTHIGQWLLGRTSGVWLPCVKLDRRGNPFAATVPGEVILFHGSSL